MYVAFKASYQGFPGVMEAAVQGWRAHSLYNDATAFINAMDQGMYGAMAGIAA